MAKRNTSLMVKTALLWLFLCLAAGAPIVISAPNADVDLAITKTDSVDPAVAGESLAYRLSVSNTGPSTATGVAITDTLPGGVIYTSASSGCTYNAGSRTVRCGMGEVGTGSTISATIQVRVDPATTGSLLNQATVATLDTDTNASNNTAQATTTITSSADLRLSMTAPASVIAGDLITYTLAISNTGPSNARGIVLRDDFPIGTSYARSSIPCSIQGHRVNCNAGIVAANTRINVTITLLVDPGKTGTITDEALISAITPDPNGTNNNASLTSTVVISSDITISKSGTPNPISPGELLTYTITTINNGLSNGQGVTFADPLPSQVSFQSYTTTKGTCTVTNPITCTIGSLTPGEINTVRLVGLVNTSASNGTITNTVNVVSTSPDPRLTNNSAFARTTILDRRADLQINKHDLSDPVRAGEVLTYTITVNNAGPGHARGVIATDTLPTGVTLRSATPSQGTCTTTICSLGTISATRNAMITLAVTMNPFVTGVITNTVSVSANETDPVLSNNTARERTTILLAPADLQVTKHDLSDPVRAGEVLTYTITVNNAGPGHARGVIATDTLPTGVTLRSATPSQGTCTTTICSLGTISATRNAMITLAVTVNPFVIGVITNSVAVSANEVDRVTGNNTAHESTTVVQVADLSVEKTGSPEPVFAGRSLTYRLQIRNHGPSRAGSVHVVDSLPPALSFVSAPTGCIYMNGSVDCNLGGLSPSSSRTITITTQVNLTASGLIGNTASVSSTATDPVQNDNQSTWTSTILAPDYELPTVTWTQPVPDSQRYDVNCQMVHLQVNATDNLAVQWVYFFRWDPDILDYVDIGYDYTAPYGWDLDTCILKANWNQIFARARDTYGNVSDPNPENRKFIWLFRHITLFLPVITK